MSEDAKAGASPKDGRGKDTSPPVVGIKWRNPYDAEECERIGRACATVNNGPVLRQEQFAQDADINVLVRRFGVEKLAEMHPINPAEFADISSAPDLRTALEMVRQAEVDFMALPPRVRLRFQNSPAELWDFLQDPENREEAEFLGLIEKPRPAALEGVSPETPGEAGEPPKGADDA